MPSGLTPYPIELDGETTSNLGVASRTLALQFPLYPREVQKALQAHLNQQMHLGTINVVTKKPVVIRPKDYDLDTGAKRIKWSDEWVPERFRFKKCALIVNETRHPAWIYCTTSSSHNVDPFLIEVICAFIPEIKLNRQVRLWFEKANVVQAISPC